MNDGCEIMYVSGPLREQLCVNDGCKINVVDGPLRGAAVCQRRL